MSASASLAVQAAIFGLLNGDTTLKTTLGVTVADAIPNKAPRPTRWVTLGESFEMPNRRFGANGHEEIVTIHVYTEDTQAASGFSVPKTIAARVIALLDGVALSVTNHATVLCHLESMVTLPADGESRHIVIDFRVLTEDS
jgi:hypothetical protein